MDEHDLLEQQKRVRGWKTLNWTIFLMSCVVEKGEKTHFGVGTSCCPKWRILKYLIHKWGRVECEWQNQRSGSCMVCCENLNMKAMLWIVTGRMTPQTFFFFLFGCVQNFSFVLLKIINIFISVPLVRQAAVLLEQERQHEMAKMQPRSMPTVTPIRGEFKQVLNNTKCYIMNLKYIC